METKKKATLMVALVGSLILAGLFVLQGCKKRPEPAAPPTAPGQSTSAPERTKEAATVAAEQTTCPVLGGPIDKSIFTEYKGKKVYFCCADCKGKFEADPEKYLAKLPQFKQ